MSYCEIYNEIRSVSAVDLLGAPRKFEGKITNATELLFDDQKLLITRFFAESEGKCIDLMSDYEIFLLFVKNLSNMAGNGVRELFETELEMLFGDAKRDAESLWKTVSDELEACGYNAKTLISNKGIVQLDVDGIYEITLCRRYARSYLDYIDEIALELAGAPYDTAYFDMSEICFERTDVYHCEEAYKRFAACRDYNKEQTDMLTSGVLYSTCEKLKKEKNARVRARRKNARRKSRGGIRYGFIFYKKRSFGVVKTRLLRLR